MHKSIILTVRCGGVAGGKGGEEGGRKRGGRRREEEGESEGDDVSQRHTIPGTKGCTYWFFPHAIFPRSPRYSHVAPRPTNAVSPSDATYSEKVI